MPSVDQLVARKGRLTHRLARREQRRLRQGKPLREQKWVRAALAKIDTQLDAAGWFDV